MPLSHTGTTPLKGADSPSGELAFELSCLGSSIFSVRNRRGTCVSPVLPPASESGPWGGGPGLRRVLFPTLAQWPEGVVTGGLERQLGPSLGIPVLPQPQLAGPQPAPCLPAPLRPQDPQPSYPFSPWGGP